MKTKTRLITITRSHTVTTETATGVQEKIVKTQLPCRINAAVPAKHRMCR